jgi:hypothetical protein
MLKNLEDDKKYCYKLHNMQVELSEKSPYKIGNVSSITISIVRCLADASKLYKVEHKSFQNPCHQYRYSKINCVVPPLGMHFFLEI